MQAPLRLIRGGQIHLPISLSTFEIEILVPSEGKKRKEKKKCKKNQKPKTTHVLFNFQG